MAWPFRLRHKPEDAPSVKEAIATRDGLFDELDDAIRAVDKVQDRVIRQYVLAEQQRVTRRHK